MSDAADHRARLAELAESQWGLLTTAQAATVGVDSKRLQRLVDQAVLVRLRYGVYRLTGVPDSQTEPLRAEWLALEPARTVAERISDDVPFGIVSHRSAANLHALGDLDADYLEFTVPTRRDTRSPDVRFHRRTLTSDEWTLVDGLPTTTPARTIGDLAASRTDGGHLASVVRDALLHGVSADDIAQKLRPYAHRYGAPVDNGSALINHFVAQAGVPESSLALSAPALEPLLAANSAWNQALSRLAQSGGSAHLAATLHPSHPPESTVAALRNQLAHAALEAKLTELLRQAVAPLTETPEWRNAMTQISTQILSTDPQRVPDVATARELAAIYLSEAVTEALLDTAAHTERPTPEVEQ